MLQEHNIRDIKVSHLFPYDLNLNIMFTQYIFMVLGPFATWDFIHKISASIPCQRKIKDHVEAEINHFHRGKSHTSPDAEGDIRCLQAAYRSDKIHEFVPGRKLEAKDKVKDYTAVGAEGAKLKKTIAKWMENRVTKWSTRETWKEERT